MTLLLPEGSAAAAYLSIAGEEGDGGGSTEIGVAVLSLVPAAMTGGAQVLAPLTWVGFRMSSRRKTMVRMTAVKMRR